MILKVDLTKVQFAHLAAFLVSAVNKIEAPTGWDWSVGSGKIAKLDPISLVSAKESGSDIAVVLEVRTQACATNPGLDPVWYNLPLATLIQMFQAMGLAPEKITKKLYK